MKKKNNQVRIIINNKQFKTLLQTKTNFYQTYIKFLCRKFINQQLIKAMLSYVLVIMKTYLNCIKHRYKILIKFPFKLTKFNNKINNYAKITPLQNAHQK